MLWHSVSFFFSQFWLRAKRGGEGGGAEGGEREGDGRRFDQCQMISYGWADRHGWAAKPLSCQRLQSKCVCVWMCMCVLLCIYVDPWGHLFTLPKQWQHSQRQENHLQCKLQLSINTRRKWHLSPFIIVWLGTLFSTGTKFSSDSVFSIWIWIGEKRLVKSMPWCTTVGKTHWCRCSACSLAESHLHDCSFHHWVNFITAYVSTALEFWSWWGEILINNFQTLLTETLVLSSTEDVSLWYCK